MSLTYSYKTLYIFIHPPVVVELTAAWAPLLRSTLLKILPVDRKYTLRLDDAVRSQLLVALKAEALEHVGFSLDMNERVTVYLAVSLVPEKLLGLKQVFRGLGHLHMTVKTP